MHETLGQAIERVKAAADLQEVALGLGMEPRGKSTYVCPICGSGTKAKHSAAVTTRGKGARNKAADAQVLAEMESQLEEHWEKKGWE